MVNNRNVVTHDDALKKSLEYFNGDTLAANVWINKYALKDSYGNLYEESPYDMHVRLSSELARIEKKYDNGMDEKEIFQLLDKFKYIVPQGSPMAGIGNDFQVSSLSNCFVVGLDGNVDSYGGIMRIDEQVVHLEKRRGGVGHDLSHIRPMGTPVKNSALTSAGIVPYMERYSNTTREVSQNSRRGALMLSVSIKHPDAESFIDAKMDAKKVTGANVSVKIGDDFMNSVINNTEFTQQYPVDSPNPKITKNINALNLWNKIVRNSHGSAEPGILFIDTIIRESLPDCYSDFGFKTISTNPCLVCDTLVAVADGRGDVKIKDLAEEGKDVQVYCLNSEGKLVIKTMLNPRITGYKQEIYKITLENGHTIRVTGNHKFRLKDGRYVETKDLKHGDSLHILTKEYKTFDKAFNSSDYDSNVGKYIWFKNGENEKYVQEHFLIAEHYHGCIDKGYVVHHKDRNKLNNNPDNLSVLSANEHNKLHAEDKKGLNNPIFKVLNDSEKREKYVQKLSNVSKGEKNANSKNITNDEIFNHGILLTKKLNYRFSNKEWLKYANEHNLPKVFTDYRKKDLGNMLEFSINCAKHCNLNNIEVDPRLQKTYNEATSQGYKAIIENGQVLVEKKCEMCGESFYVSYFRREMAFCGLKCSNKYLNGNVDVNKNRVEQTEKYNLNRSKELKTKQLDIYTELRLKINRVPYLKEWEVACSEKNVAYRLNTIYGFKNFAELKENAEYYNHRIVSIELDGFEDVYCGTVEQHHNYFVGGFKEKINNEDDDNIFSYKTIYLNNLNCGEIALCDKDSCRLLAINLFSYVVNRYTSKAYFDFDLFKSHAMKAQRLMDDIVDLEIEKIDKILEKIESDPESDDIKSVEKNLWIGIREKAVVGRRCGLGITAEGDMLAAMNLTYGSDEAIEFSKEVHKTMMLSAYRSSVEMAKERGRFEIYDSKLEENNPYMLRMKEYDIDLYNDMVVHGRRNIAILTAAPTGSLSILTQTTSGIEPVFKVAYKRRKKINPNDKNVKVDFIDDMGDKFEEFYVFHHHFKTWLGVNGYNIEDVMKLRGDELNEIIKKSPYYNATSDDINWINRVKTQAAIQQFICHSISSTVNLPSTATEELVSEIYKTAWEYGCKGITVYRDGSRSGILVDEKSGNKDDKSKEIAKRPKSIKCDVIRFKNNGEDWVCFVGLMDEKPYEIFTGKLESFTIPKNVSGGLITKVKIKKTDDNGEEIKSRFDFEYFDADGYKVVMEGLSRAFDREYWNYGKLLSGLLRHKMDLNYIIKIICDLNMGENGDLIGSWKKGVIRILGRYIKDDKSSKAGEYEECPTCHQKTVIRENGCKQCINPDCGHSQCGG